jgi:hypothetical protein
MAREVPLHACRILMNSVIRVPSPPEIYKLPIWECDSKLFSGLRTLTENDFHFIIYVSNIFSTNHHRMLYHGTHRLKVILSRTHP